MSISLILHEAGKGQIVFGKSFSELRGIAESISEDYKTGYTEVVTLEVKDSGLNRSSNSNASLSKIYYVVVNYLDKDRMVSVDDKYTIGDTLEFNVKVGGTSNKLLEITAIEK